VGRKKHRVGAEVLRNCDCQQRDARA
jgi:hypothetical protein